MKIERQCFIVLSRDVETSRRTVKIHPEMDSVLAEWGPSTRVSPIFTVEGFGKSKSPSTEIFRGQSWLVFTGPVHPQDVADGVPASGVKMWLSLGLYNVLLLTSSQNKLDQIRSRARKNQWPHEVWQIKNGRLLKQDFSKREKPPQEFAARIQSFAKIDLPLELHEAILEYCPLMLAAATRGTQLPSDFLLDLAAIHDHVQLTIDKLGQSSLTTYQILGQILNVNAALSRFTSQTFAGTSPIVETECHFWSNSLLGIGLADLAVWRITKFLEKTLGSARLSDRVRAFAAIKDKVPSISGKHTEDSFWSEDHLAKCEVIGPASKIIPTLTYFSGREGFNSTELTISAPLASISACNSARWSLLTLTHEISHILVSGMIVKIYPQMKEPKQQAAVKKLIKERSCSTLLDEIRLLLLETVLGMNAVQGKDYTVNKYRADDLVTIIEHWQRDVEEILVHTFDFLYFYGRETDKYVRGIWMSWATVPNINNRIKDYVTRTISAVLARYLLLGEEAEEQAKDAVVAALTKLHEDSGGPHCAEALAYIQKSWNDEIKGRVVARKDLVKIVQAFFFSDHFATALRREDAVVGGTDKDHQGSPLQQLHIDTRRIGNPLIFLERFTFKHEPSTVESAWFYYVLAFRMDS